MFAITGITGQVGGATAEALLAAGKDMRREALLLAAYRRYTRGVDEMGNRFEVAEPQLTGADWELLRSDDPVDALRASPFAAWGLAESGRFVDVYRRTVEILDAEGVHAALRFALQAQP